MSLDSKIKNTIDPYIPIQYPYDEEGFAEVLSVDDQTKIMDYMEKYGFIVIPVLDDDACDQTIRETWHEMNIEASKNKSVDSNELDPEDLTTWETENWPEPDHVYLSKHHAYSPQAYVNMLHPNVVKVFKLLHNTDKLIMSVPLVSIKRPRSMYGTRRKDWDINPLRLHLDRDTERPYHERSKRYQAEIALVDSDYSVGGFAAVPGSSAYIKKYPEIWLNVDQGKYIKDGVLTGTLHANLQQIPIRKGNMVIWDRSTVHANYIGHPANELPRITQFTTVYANRDVNTGLETTDMRAHLNKAENVNVKQMLLKMKLTIEEQQYLGLIKYV